MSRILVYCEMEEGGAIRKASRQALTAARGIGGGQVEALLIGKGAGEAAARLGEYGVARAAAVEYDGPYSTAVWTAAAGEAIGETRPCLFLAGHTAIARDFTPRLGARLNCPNVPDTVEISGEVGAIQVRRPIYAGKAFEEIKSGADCLIVTLRPNAVVEEKTEAGASPEVVKLDPPSPPENLQTTVRETIKPESEEIDLTEADVVVSGGIGVGGPEGFEFIRPLAEALGAALGSSRAAVLAGWISPEHQVGQTGKTVTPQLYVALGISGAIQHRAGMSSSKTIVAVNKDPEAPIFEIADYGIVNDLFKVVPLMIEAVKAVKSS